MAVLAALAVLAVPAGLATATLPFDNTIRLQRGRAINCRGEAPEGLPVHLGRLLLLLFRPPPSRPLACTPWLSAFALISRLTAIDFCFVSFQPSLQVRLLSGTSVHNVTSCHDVLYGAVPRCKVREAAPQRPHGAGRGREGEGGEGRG